MCNIKHLILFTDKLCSGIKLTSSSDFSQGPSELESEEPHQPQPNDPRWAVGANFSNIKPATGLKQIPFP